MNPRIRPEDRARWQPGFAISDAGKAEPLDELSPLAAGICAEADHAIIRARIRARLTTPETAQAMRMFLALGGRIAYNAWRDTHASPPMWRRPKPPSV